MSTSIKPDAGLDQAGQRIIELLDPLSEYHQHFISQAHTRSQAAGLDSHIVADYSRSGAGELRDLIEKNNQLRNCALPYMATLYEQVTSTHSMVLLTDASGIIIESLGDDDFLERAEKVALSPGVDWSEDQKGTNAIGTALVEKLPTVVHGSDHFLDVNQFLTCSAAPIFDPRGVPIGVLDVTGDYRSYHRHTMGLVRMSAQMIENHLFNSSFQDAIIVTFHQRGEFLGSVVECAAAFHPSGKFLAANRAAMVQFGMSTSALCSHTFSSLFGMPISALIDHYRATNPLPLVLCLHNGNQVTARASLGSVGRSRIFDSVGLIKGNQEATKQEHSATAKPSDANGCSKAARHLSSLKYLNTGDPQINKVIDKVSKVIGKDIPILILGETGTGKEILAQAIHNDSPRKDKPFVAVNCASIPETLIESELFGYEDGAFTGAKKKGSTGKILQANGGTLFLDEIGDMPMPLQARLLRVLQERVVTPLGSQKSIPVNLQVICATHRNLRECIASGSFREDLYYRLHGLVVKLPALRERSDLSKIVARILESESPNPRMTVAAPVLEAFRAHCWPGNIRQLTNILRTSSVMAESTGQILWEHLPDDFIDEWESLKSTKRSTCAPTLSEQKPIESEPLAHNVNSLNVPNLSGQIAQPQPGSRPRFSIQNKITGYPTTPSMSDAVPTGFQRNQSIRQVATNPQKGSLSVQTRIGAKKQTLQTTQPDNPRHNLEQTFNRLRHHRMERMFAPRAPSYASQSDHGLNLDEMESQAIREALETCRGNVSAAARMLGISRNTIYRRLGSK